MNHCVLLPWLLLLACVARTSRAECVDRAELDQIIAGVVQKVEDDNRMLRMKVDILENTVAELTKGQDVHLRDHEKRLLLADPETSGVAFSVSVSPLDIANLGAKQTIRFDKVITNLGNVYSNITGVFTAPLTGWYVFSLTLMDNPNEVQRLDVVKDGVHIFHCFVNGNEFNTASRTMVLQVNKGSTVWVQTAFATTAKVHGDEHTSFTGFLLYQYV